MLITDFVASEATGRFPESKTTRVLDAVGRLQAERVSARVVGWGGQEVDEAMTRNVRKAR